ncbi:MAG: metal-dependent phosphohydrolase [Actinomycetes bacterium]
MEHRPPRLVQSFTTACQAAGARAAAVDVEAAAVDLLRRWADPARGYHDVEHLEEVLDAVRRLAGRDLPTVVLAAWFHDAVYDGVPGEDERRSAELADEELAALGVPADVCRRVADLVLVTAQHDPAEDDEEAAVLCDADLAVLAADRARYGRYVAGVRKEYRNLQPAVFAAGRADVLRRLLQRPAIYRTAVGRGLWEEAARRNLKAELEQLEGCG